MLEKNEAEPGLTSFSFFFVGVQRFLSCKTEEFDLDMDGEKALICYKEITTALRQWILPTFVSPPSLFSYLTFFFTDMPR